MIRYLTDKAVIFCSVWRVSACPVGVGVGVGVGGGGGWNVSVRYSGQQRVTVFIPAGLEGEVHP